MTFLLPRILESSRGNLSFYGPDNFEVRPERGGGGGGGGEATKETTSQQKYHKKNNI